MLKTVDAVILAGGLGTRLRPLVEETPKCLAKVNNLPFLTYKINQLKQAGVQRIILCLGHQAEQIREYFDKHPVPGVTIEYVYEKKLLGTAGALKNAEPLIQSENFVALNGDCYLDINYQAFVGQHLETMAQASLALVRLEDPSRYGLVTFNPSLEITAFLEKQGTLSASHPAAGSYINAGTYCFHRSLLEEIPPDRPCSLEYDIFPMLIGQRFYAFPVESYFIDIGTPESFEQVQQDVLSGKLKVAL